MAKRFEIQNPISEVFSVKWLVAAGSAASIDRGAPVEGADAAAASPWTGAVNIMADAEGSTSQRFVGIAKTVSTDTVSAAGEVYTYLPFPGIVYSGYAKTSTTADTAAEILALMGKRVVFDLTSGDWTIDAAAADAVANNVTIVGGDHNTKKLSFVYSPKGTALAFCISA